MSLVVGRLTLLWKSLPLSDSSYLEFDVLAFDGDKTEHLRYFYRQSYIKANHGLVEKVVEKAVEKAKEIVFYVGKRNKTDEYLEMLKSGLEQ